MLTYLQDKEPNPLESKHHCRAFDARTLKDERQWLEEYAKNMKMYTTVKKFQVSKIVMFLKEDYFSPKLHLFNKKYTKNSNIVKMIK